ncbi:hypothetical protein TRVA0_031S00276 [Trichomonascus vanleenenianus]|uniref:uncharacterized protein n=1 Tax=Trichomonascus vanleenenianus TaxID=2268995 RepID=UPI003ECA76B3
MIPGDIWYHIIDSGELSKQDLCNLRVVSKQLEEIVNRRLWANLALAFDTRSTTAAVGRHQHQKKLDYVALREQLLSRIHSRYMVRMYQSDIWKIVKVWGVERAKFVFGNVTDLYLITDYWQPHEDGLIEELPEWYSDNTVHLRWFTPKLPEFFPNVKRLSVQAHDFRDVHRGWQTFIPHIFGLFPGPKVYKFLEIVFSHNLRTHDEDMIPYVDVNSLSLDFSSSPIEAAKLPKEYLQSQLESLVVVANPKLPHPMVFVGPKVEGAEPQPKLKDAYLPHLDCSDMDQLLRNVEELTVSGTKPVSFYTLPKLKKLTVCTIESFDLPEQVHWPVLEELRLKPKRRIKPATKLIHERIPSLQQFHVYTGEKDHVYDVLQPTAVH